MSARILFNTAGATRIEDFSGLFRNAEQLQLTHLSIDTSWYHLTATALAFTEAAVSYSAVLIPGNYSLSELETMLAAALTTASGSVYTVTIDPSSYLITISVAATTFGLLLASGATSAQLASILGFAQTDQAEAASQVGIYPVRTRPTHIYLVSSTHTGPLRSSVMPVAGACAIIPVTSTFSREVLALEPSWMLTSLSRNHVHFSLYNQFGDELDLLTGKWTVTLS